MKNDAATFVSSQFQNTGISQDPADVGLGRPGIAKAVSGCCECCEGGGGGGYFGPFLACIEGEGIKEFFDGIPDEVTDEVCVIEGSSPTLISGLISICEGFNPLTDLLAFVDTVNITGSWDADTGIMTLTGIDSIANYETALRSVTFVRTAPPDAGIGWMTIGSTFIVGG